MRINAGELNRAVKLKRPRTGTTNSFGESVPANVDDPLETYEPVCHAKRMQDRPGLEIREGGQAVAKSPAAFLVRYDPRIMARDIVDDEGRLFEITNVRDPDGGRVGLFLECNEYAGS